MGGTGSPQTIIESIMKPITHWKAAAFCAFLSLFALVGIATSGTASWWQPAFYSFLPMCFFHVALVTTQMHRELSELRKKVADLEQRKSN